MKRKKKSERLPLLSERPRNFEKTESEVFFVLDEDPIKAARSLIIRHVRNYTMEIAKSLTYAYMINVLQMGKQYVKSRYGLRPRPFIYRTAGNITFFSLMYEELERLQKEYLHGRVQELELRHFNKDEVLFNFDLATYKDNKELQIPNYLQHIKNNKNLARYNIYGIDNASNTPIDLMRMMYIIDGYPIQNFPCGAPEWYTPACREVFRKYDRLSKKTFVIHLDPSGYYRFYYQHISNKLREITTLEGMRELIDCLLYQS